MTLDEIRAKLAIRDKGQEETSPVPISMEQYQTWQTLKTTNQVKEPIDLVASNRKSITNTLECPSCNSSNMHHISVEVFNRNEDAITGEHINLTVKESHGWDCLNVIPPEHSVDSNMKNNPSDRRTGVSIAFVCEECHAIVNLGIGQHKGQSNLTWRYYK